MALKRMVGGLVVLLLGPMAAPAYAQGLRDVSSVIERVDQSSRLVRYGRETKNPMALILAAQMLRESGLEPAMANGAPPSGRDHVRFPSPKMLVAEAKAMARGRPALRRLADDVLASGEKGRERGPLFEIAEVGGSGSAQVDAMRFAPGKRAEVYVEGNDRIAVAVFGADGQPICRDDRGSDVAYCWWQPAGDRAVRIEVINKSNKAVTYRLVTN